jgi:glycosyltransferase involved in cell wall biosynthesis
MNILWLISDKNGCGTYRSYIPSLSLQSHHTFDYLLHWDSYNTSPEKELDGKDLLIFQRPSEPKFTEWQKVAKRMGIPTIVEMDDDLFNIPRHSPAFWYYSQAAVQKTVLTLLDETNSIICSTQPLQQIINAYVGRSDIRICPNHLHPVIWGSDQFTGIQPLENKTTVIGWQGTSTHDVDFKEALPAIKQVMEEHPVMIRFFGGVPESIRGEIPGNRFQWMPWKDFVHYPKTLRRLNFDIGLAPITNSKFNQSKSNIKWLEYSALKIPTIASRVFPYEKSIDHGVTGFLASNTEEWYNALKKLILDAESRHEMAQRAYCQTWEKYGPSHARSWERTFQLTVKPTAASGISFFRALYHSSVFDARKPVTP